MVEGALADAGREPRNVSVCVLETDEGVAVRLEDENGIFMDLAPDPGGRTSPTDSGEGSEGAGENHVDETEAEGEAEVETDLRRANGKIAELRGEVSALRDEIENGRVQFESQIAREEEQLAKEKERYKKLWSKYCARCSHDDEVLDAMEREVEDLRKRLSEYTHHPSTRPHTPVSYVAEPVSVDTPRRVETSDVRAPAAPLSPLPRTTTPPRRGKAPPIDMFNGESNFEDWLPALQRSATWNSWSEDETLLQLAGHLRGRALEEWNLMDEGERADLSKAVACLKRRLDPGSKMLAAQDFRRASQNRSEPVADYIRLDWRECFV